MLNNMFENERYRNESKFSKSLVIVLNTPYTIVRTVTVALLNTVL